MGRKKEISSYQYFNQMKIFDNYGGYNIMDSFAFGGNCGLRNPFQHDTQALIIIICLQASNIFTLTDFCMWMVIFEAVSKRILANHAPPATSGIPFCNDDLFCLNKGEYLNYYVIYTKIFTNPAPPATSGIFFCNKDLFCFNKGGYLNCVIFIKSKYDLRFIKQYRNIIKNETIRIMMSIDILVYEAKHLFGAVRTRIFFDLLDEELFKFGSPQAISYFLPNMADSAVRLDVTSFFEHSSDIVNRIMALLLGCPDSQTLQQMPEPKFITLLQSVIVSFLSNNKTKRGQSNKGTKTIRLIMAAPGLFVIADGEEIPEDVLVGLRHGDELIMNSLVDAGLERMQASEIQDLRPIHSPYFPNNCRLFIYIPTENGSYWHKMDMMRDNRIRRHGR